MRTLTFDITDQLDKETKTLLDEEFKKKKEFVKNLPFEVHDDLRETTPIRFKHDEQSRQELKKERTTEELLDIIFKSGIEDLVINATFNNNLNFMHSGFFMDIQQKGDNIIIVDPKNEYMTLPFEEYPELKRLLEKYPPEQIQAFLYHKDEDFEFEFLGFDKKSEIKEFIESEDSTRFVCEKFLETIPITTLHKLGKVINKGKEIQQEYIENMHEYF